MAPSNPEARSLLHMHGPFADIQNTKRKRQIADVAVFDDFPFTRSVQMNTEGVEIPNSVKCITQRRLTAAELEEAKAGEDIFVSEDGTDDEVDDDGEEDTDDDEMDEDGDWDPSDGGEEQVTRSKSARRKSSRRNIRNNEEQGESRDEGVTDLTGISAPIRPGRGAKRARK